MAQKKINNYEEDTLQREVNKVLADSSLSKEEKNQQIVELVRAHKTPDIVFEQMEASAERRCRETTKADKRSAEFERKFAWS